MLHFQMQQGTADFVNHFWADLSLTQDLQVNRIPPACDRRSDSALFAPNAQAVLPERKSKASRLASNRGFECQLRVQLWQKDSLLRERIVRLRFENSNIGGGPVAVPL